MSARERLVLSAVLAVIGFNMVALAVWPSWLNWYGDWMSRPVLIITWFLFGILFERARARKKFTEDGAS